MRDHLDPDHWVNGGEHDNSLPEAKAFAELEEKCKKLNQQIKDYKRFCLQGANVIDTLRLRLLNRTPDNRDQYPADRAALLDADRWLSEAYRVNVVNKDIWKTS